MRQFLLHGPALRGALTRWILERLARGARPDRGIDLVARRRETG